ncbi:MFS transporter [Streptomyces sp. NPDC050485]|uniref:MFS transporter n=1 Tax=Streptomyces sp. NPDC050485 TaxID=3365617 RepID=UPI0037ADEAEE
MVTESPIESDGPATLRRTGFARLWTATTFSALADGLYLMVLPLVALDLTRSPTLISGIRVAQTLAGFAIGLLAGVLVDRFNRKRLTMHANLIRGTCMLALAVTASLGGLHLPMLYAAAFLIGIAETVTDTAEQALVPMVVEKERLSRANSLIYGTQTVLNDFVGAPLGAALLGVATAVALYTPAGLYLAAVVVLLPLSGRFTAQHHTTTRSSVMADVKAGVKELWRDKALFQIALFQSCSQFANMAFFSVFVVFAVGSSSALGLSEFGYSLLITAAAAGAVLGSVCADRVIGRLRGRTVLLLMTGGLTLCFGAPAVLANPFAVGAALAVSGFVTAVGGIFTVSFRQSLVHESMLGRVTAGSRMLSLAARPLGALAGGAIAQLASPRALFILLALIMAASVGLVWRVSASLPGPSATAH